MKIENFFGILRDGDWHNIAELADQTKIPADKLTEFSRFVSKEQGIIAFKERTQQIKIESKWKNLLPDEIEPRSISQSPSRKNKTKFNLTKSEIAAKPKQKLRSDSATKSKK
jgi:hypothetical protein